MEIIRGQIHVDIYYFHVILGSQKIVIPSQSRSYAIWPAILIQKSLFEWV